MPIFVWVRRLRLSNRECGAHLCAGHYSLPKAYSLTRGELRYILDPADVKGADYPSETFRVLKDKEIRHYGECRTRRLVLAAWDRMEASGEFTRLGM